MNSNFEMMSAIQLRCRVQAKQIESFKSGKKFVEIQKEYRTLLRLHNRTVKQFEYDMSGAHSETVTVRNYWSGVMDDPDKEHRQEIQKVSNAVTYEAASHVLELEEINRNLTAQVNHNYENSSLPSSKCIGRKKITNNREKSGKKPGAQKGHTHHPRKKLTPTKTVQILPDEKFFNTSGYTPSGQTITKQFIGITVSADVIEYSTMEFLEKSTGHRGNYAHLLES